MSLVAILHEVCEQERNLGRDEGRAEELYRCVRLLVVGGMSVRQACASLHLSNASFEELHSKYAKLFADDRFDLTTRSWLETCSQTKVGAD